MADLKCLRAIALFLHATALASGADPEASMAAMEVTSLAATGLHQGTMGCPGVARMAPMAVLGVI